MARVELTREAIGSAIAECERLGRKAFLDTYGFKGAKDYFLVVNGRNYDSKAIVAVAHKFVPTFGRALRQDQLSGGVADAAGRLRKLGFDVTTPGENADWGWDEHVLALQLYMQNPASPPGKGSDAILELSQLLNQLGERMGVARTTKFRNANGVYMKLMNFRRLDPTFQAVGKAGLPRGAKGEEAVWAAFRGDLPRLHAAANAIRLALADASVVLTLGDDDYEADESLTVLRLHKSRERDRKLVEKKKARVLNETGCLSCEVCGFNFSERYGAHGRGYIEAHHRKPISKLVLGEKTRLDDLALVCANCHRMLHRGLASLTTDALKLLLTAGRGAREPTHLPIEPA